MSERLIHICRQLRLDHITEHVALQNDPQVSQIAEQILVAELVGGEERS